MLDGACVQPTYTEILESHAQGLSHVQGSAYRVNDLGCRQWMLYSSDKSNFVDSLLLYIQLN